MKKTLILLCLLLAGLFICAKQAQAGVIFEQTKANGYWLTDGSSLSYFCDYNNNCIATTNNNRTEGVMTNFNGIYPFITPEGKVIKSVRLSLAKTFDMADPGRIFLWCDGFPDNYFFYSTQSLKAADLDVNNFKYFQFDFPTSPCKKLRGLSFENYNDNVSGLKIEVNNEDLIKGYGMGYVQWAGGTDGYGGPTSHENYEAYIQISDADGFTEPLPSSDKVPVLIIPGVLGTDIKKGDEFLWADIEKMVNPFLSNKDSFMDPLQFENNLRPQDIGINIGDVIRKKTKIINNKEITLFDYTDSLIKNLVNTGYIEGKDLFTFPYDWRYGVSGKFDDGTTVVDKLKGQIDYILTQTEAGKNAGKVNIVAHSMGGLVLKKYVQLNQNNHHIGKAIFVGVPNLGAPKAYKVLMIGDSFDIIGLNGDEMKKIGQNLPAIYDLSPSTGYENLGSTTLKLIQHSIFADKIKIEELNINEAQQYLENKYQANNLGFSNANNLHTDEFDNLNLNNLGVDAYNIVGCKTWTLGAIQESSYLGNITYYGEGVSGDGTVPFVSANSMPVPNTNIFYAKGKDHSQMLSADGVRQKIVNLLTAGSLDVGSSVITKEQLQNKPDSCKLNGQLLQMLSPAYLIITDSLGNKSTIAEDGSVQNDIPGASYDLYGEHKFVFLPTDEGQAYTINLVGTGTGTFTLNDQTINEGEIIKAQIFSNLPVTTSLYGQVNLGGENNPTTLTLKSTPTSTPTIIYPSSILNSNESKDLIPPVSTSTILGLMGQTGFYRSNVTVALAALDPIIDGKPEETSGVLKTQYSIDDGDYLVNSTSSPIVITAEGAHTIKFYSTDRAGNNEPEREISFVIDRTPPELIFSFNPKLKDLEFFATDTLATIVTSSSTSSKFKWPKIPALKFKDSDNIIIATDAAGNTIQLELKDKNRKLGMKAEIKSLKYNGQSVNIGNSKLAFLWIYDKKGNLSYLLQNVQSKVGFNILAVYNGSKTILVGKEGKGLINKTLTGLNILTFSSLKGDLSWSIRSVILSP